MLGFVTGLTSEARLLAPISALVAVGGGTADGAEAAARRLVEQGATSLFSFGLAGGLDPSLAAGDLVVPASVVGLNGRYSCDRLLLRYLGGATVEALAGVDNAVQGAAAKEKLFQATGAAAVDIESIGLARVASANGLPFAVLRAVADPAGRNLPPAAMVALDAFGRIALGRVIGSLVRKPNQIFDLIRLAGETAAGRRTLLAQVKLRF